MIADQICKAFCKSVVVNKLSNGYGISTSLFEIEGDPAGLYAIGPDETGHWRLEDSGRLISALVAMGYDLGSEQRRKALEAILDSAGAQLDQDGYEIATGPISESDLPVRAIQLIGVLARVADLQHLTSGRVRSTFKEDVRIALQSQLPSDVEMVENAVADDRIVDLRADIVLTSAGRASVALFLAQHDLALVEAMLLRSESQNIGKDRPQVMALLERENAVSKNTRTRAMNRLDTVAVYESDEAQAIKQVVQFVQNAPRKAA